MQQLVTAELKQQGMQIDSEALALLISKTNSDYSQIMAELPKLMLYAQQTKQITTGAVAELVSSSIEDNVFFISTACFAEKSGPRFDDVSRITTPKRRTTQD